MKKSRRSTSTLERLTPLLIALSFTLVAATGFATEVQSQASMDPELDGRPQPAAEPADLASYDGVWRGIDTEETEPGRLASIETALGGVPWIVRKMGAGVLRRSTAPPPEMRFAWDGERLHQLVVDGNGSSRRPVRLDQEPVVLKDHRGEDFASNWTWTDAGLQVNWKQHQAYGTNVYRIDEQRQTLFVEHRIHITAISNVEPIVYRSRFERSGLPAVSAAMGAESAEGPASEFR